MVIPGLAWWTFVVPSVPLSLVEEIPSQRLRLPDDIANVFIRSNLPWHRARLLPDNTCQSPGTESKLCSGERGNFIPRYSEGEAGENAWARV